VTRAILILLAACGDNQIPARPDGVTIDAAVGCTVMLSGNLVETSTTMAACPTLGAGTLAFSIASQEIGEPLGVQIYLGPSAVAGMYSSETIATWSAVGLRAVAPSGACVYLAGATAVPSGNFTLTLDSIDPLAGSLAMTLYVLARTTDQGVQTDCGAGSTEDLRVTF
jgi:hypothetical protein